MGCFLACFGDVKDRKRRRSPKKSLPLERVHERYRLSRSNVSRKQITPMPLTPKISPPNLPVGTGTEITPMPLTPKISPPNLPVDTVTDTLLQLKCHDLIQENLAQGSFRRTRKKVTFDLNVQTHEYVLGDEDPKCPSEDDEATQVIDEERKPHKGQDKSFTKFGSFPSYHRYQNCGSSDDDEGVSEEDEEEEDYEDCDIDEEEDGNEEASYDFLSSFGNDDEPQGVQGVEGSQGTCGTSEEEFHERKRWRGGGEPNGAHGQSKEAYQTGGAGGSQPLELVVLVGEFDCGRACVEQFTRPAELIVHCFGRRQASISCIFG